MAEDTEIEIDIDEVEFEDTEELEPETPVSRVSGPDGGFGVPSDQPLLMDEEPGIRLKNLRNRPAGITLEHEVYCVQIGRCVCATRTVIRDRRIERGSSAMAPREVDIRIPVSFNLPPRETSQPIHEAARDCVDVSTRITTRPQKLKILPV